MVNSLWKELWPGRKTENVMSEVLWMKKNTNILCFAHDDYEKLFNLWPFATLRVKVT
jgi:hypothetical protein